MSEETRVVKINKDDKQVVFLRPEGIANAEWEMLAGDIYMAFSVFVQFKALEKEHLLRTQSNSQTVN